MANLNVCGRHRSRASTEKNIFRCGLKKVIHNLVRAHWAIAKAAKDCLRICARTGSGHAMKVAEEGVDNREIPARPQHDSARGLVLGSTVYPQPIEHQMIGWSLKLDQVVNATIGSGSRDFQTEQAIVVCPGSKRDRPRTALSREFDFGEGVVGGATVQIRSTRKSGDTGITGSQPSALRR